MHNDPKNAMSTMRESFILDCSFSFSYFSGFVNSFLFLRVLLLLFCLSSFLVLFPFIIIFSLSFGLFYCYNLACVVRACRSLSKFFLCWDRFTECSLHTDTLTRRHTFGCTRKKLKLSITM